MKLFKLVKIFLFLNQVLHQLSIEELETLKSSELFKEMTFGGIEAQIGLCMGYNSEMNALEFHNSSEINIAVTPLVVLLGLRYEIKDISFNKKPPLIYVITYIKGGRYTTF